MEIFISFPRQNRSTAYFKFLPLLQKQFPCLLSLCSKLLFKFFSKHQLLKKKLPFSLWLSAWSLTSSWRVNLKTNNQKKKKNSFRSSRFFCDRSCVCLKVKGNPARDQKRFKEYLPNNKAEHCPQSCRLAGSW